MGGMVYFTYMKTILNPLKNNQIGKYTVPYMDGMGKNHGISSHWWFGDLKEPREKNKIIRPSSLEGPNHDS